MADTIKQLVLAVDISGAMTPYWSTIVSDYLHKIIWSFCGNEDPVETSGNFEFGLVVFNDKKYSSHVMSQFYGRTRDVKLLFYWLEVMRFSSGFNASIAEGLTEALNLFGAKNVSQNGHCILVVASNPDPPVYEKCLSDAKTVAKSFSESGVSLSVISPKSYPILNEIYNAGKMNPAAADHTIDTGIITVLPNRLSAQDMVNWNTVLVGNNPPETVQASGPSNQTFEHVTSGSKNVNILNKLASQVPFLIPTGISTVGGINLGIHISNLISEGPTYPLSWSSSIAMSQPLDGNLEGQQLVHNIPATGTMMSHEQLVQLQSSQQLVHSIPATGTMMSNEQVQLQSSQPTYVTVWEGELICPKNGQTVFITRLQGYQISTSYKSLAEDWPRTMIIDSCVSNDLMTNNQLLIKADLLGFRSMDQHVLLDYIQENNLCAVIHLPSQLLLLGVSDQPFGLVGMLLPKQQSPSQQQQQQPPSQQQQQGRVIF